MSWAILIPMVIQLMPMIVQGIQKAEKLYTGLKEGVIKKQYVMDLIRNGFDIGSYYTTDLDRHMATVMRIADAGIYFWVVVAGEGIGKIRGAC